jgi:ribose transport system permease protein
MNIVRQMSVVGITAIGMTFVIISGGIDLSAGGVAAYAGVIVASLLKEYGLPVPVAIGGGLLLGMVLGLFNGIVITKGRVQPFIATLAMMSFSRGMAFVYREAQPIYGLPDSFKFLGSGYIGPVPVQVVILLVGMTIAWIVLTRTRFGRRVYAVGGSEEAARLSGINTDNLRITVFTIMGCLAALSGVLLAARVNAGDPTSGQGLELDAIAAVVMGGTSLGGGRGRLMGSLIGTLVIGVIDNGLVLLNISPWYQPVVKAVVILFAVLADRQR